MPGLGRIVATLGPAARGGCRIFFIVAGIHDQADMGLDHASLGAGKSGLAAHDDVPDPSIDRGTE